MVTVLFVVLAGAIGGGVFDRLSTGGFLDPGSVALEHPGKYRVLFSDPADLPERPEPVGLSAFDQLVEVVADILIARDDGRDPVFVAVQVHTWIHGMVSLLACHPEGPWPSVDDLLDDLVVRLDLGPPT